MLDSKVGHSGTGDESVLAFQRNGVVVQRGYDKSRLTARPRLVRTADPSSREIAFDVAPETLSQGARAWLGKEVTAYALDGKLCSGRVSHFEVRVEAVPHFGMIQSWAGQADAPKASPEQIAAEIEGMAQAHEHFVVGVLDKPCSGVWASAVPLPFVAPHPTSVPLRQNAVAAFKALPAYATQQQQFQKEMKDTRAWETVDGQLVVEEIGVVGKSGLLLVTARGGIGCGGFAGRLSAFWRIEGGADAPKLTAVGQALPEYLELHGALDEGAAGLALLVGPYDIENEVSVVRPLAAMNRKRVLYSVAFWDCGC
jgi:hypothetical protein